MEIKFRGKRLDDNEWITGYYGFKDLMEEHFIMVPTLQTDNPFLYQYFTDYQVIPESVGQFTGLKDKKGTEIYNHDIVEASAQINGYPKGNRYLVEWNDHECYYDLLSLSGYLIAKLTHNKCKSLTVVGNKYDNSEMIEGEE